MVKRIAVYGTLREGGYNYRKSIGKPLFSGFVPLPYIMVLPYSYPALVNDNNMRDVKIEVYDVPDSTYNSIDIMELGAGYHKEEIETPVGKADIWVWARERAINKTYPIIKSGDYIAEYNGV